MMKIVVDDKIPFIRGVFEPFAEVVYKKGSDISREDLTDAQVLITRTRTQCNAQLLEGTSIKFIASATIGFDHIDSQFCEQNNIMWTNAAGCNSSSVVQYVLAALLQIAQQSNIDLQKQTIGIVGVGNVGTKLATLCKLLNMKVLLCDAPRKDKEKNTDFIDINDLAAQADIISFHVPLNNSGPYKTHHLFNTEFSQKLKAKILINTSRGEVVETAALKKALANKQIDYAAIDVWENEPNIDKELLSAVSIATPHIAGYSADGKAMGTTMVVRAVSKFLNLGIDNWRVSNIQAIDKNIYIDGKNKSEFTILNEIVKASYDIFMDDDLLKTNIESFEQFRANYRIRREFDYFNLIATNIDSKQIETLKQIGFNIL